MTCPRYADMHKKNSPPEADASGGGYRLSIA